MSKATSKWQFEFSDSILSQKYGPMFISARKNSRGIWLTPEEVPAHVRLYLNLYQPEGSHNWHYEGATSCAEIRKQVAEAGEKVQWQKMGDPLHLRGTVEIDNPLKPVKPKPRKIAKSVPAIRNFEDLLNHFGVEKPQKLNRAMFNETDCGASISVQTPDGKWYHNGGDWRGITEIKAFTIQTIVEGSEATVDSPDFTLPVTVKEVDEWIKEMESEADYLWRRDNSQYYSVWKGGKLEFYAQWVEGDDKPEGVTEDELPLAIKAHEAIWDKDTNPLVSQGMRTINYQILIPIPGTEYFVREEQGPDE